MFSVAPAVCGTDEVCAVATAVANFILFSCVPDLLNAIAAIACVAGAGAGWAIACVAGVGAIACAGWAIAGAG